MSKVLRNENNLNSCSCPSCPSFNECSKEKNEALFCAEEVGKGKCVYKMNGCICSACHVHKESGLKAGYYCIYGSAEDVG